MNERPQRKLPPVGSMIQWFGTQYTVIGHAFGDCVVVRYANGHTDNLWWPYESEGRKVISLPKN